MLGTILGFFTGGSKTWIYIIGGIAIAAVVAGFWFYQRSIVSNLEDKIAEKDRKIEELNVEITGLRIDNERLTLSNQSLERERERLVEDAATIREEIEEVNRLRDESQQRLNEFEQKQRDTERQERIKAIREGERASLLLGIINRNLDCFVDNFERTDGTCINGEFRVGR